MTEWQTVALVLGLYVAFELVAIPLGHMIGKRAGGTRATLLVLASLALLVLIVTGKL